MQDWYLQCKYPGDMAILHKAIDGTLLWFFMLMLQAQAAEINSLRDELTATKKERSKLQARVAELKGALENSLAQAKVSHWY